MHHNIMYGYQALGKVALTEFIDYYAHVSALVSADSQFTLLVENVWNVDNRNNVES